MANASPGDRLSTHDLVLTQGASSIGLNWCDGSGRHDPEGFRKQTLAGTSLKIYSGDALHSDLELPWKPISQVDWSDGMGNLYFEGDQAAYYHGEGIDTTKTGQIILAGMTGWSTGIRNTYQHWPDENLDTTRDYFGFYGDSSYIATPFTATANGTMLYVSVIARAVGTPAGNLYAAIYSDDTGAPDALVGSAGAVSGSGERYWVESVATISAALTSGTDYWLVLYSANGTAANHHEVFGVEDTFPPHSLAASADGIDWDGGQGIFNYRISPAHQPATHIPFEYKNALYCVRQPDDLTVAPTLWLNGDHGVATGGSTTTLVDSTKSWTTDEWAGCTVKIYYGAGAIQPRAFATISSNTGTTLTFPAMATAPGANSVYAILGSNKWSEITNGASAIWAAGIRVTDVLVTHYAVYFATETVIRRMTRYNAAGTWTTLFDSGGDAETGQYAYLVASTDQTGSYIYGFQRTGAWGRATAVNWIAGTGAAALSFTSLGVIGDPSKRLTGATVFGEYGWPYVFREDGIYYCVDGKAYRLNVAEMGNAPDYRNGAANAAMGQYLWFSWQNGVVRLINQTIDAMGLEHTDGGPEFGTSGDYVHLLAYPGKMIAAYQSALGPYSEISAVHFHNGSGRGGVGWCNPSTPCHPMSVDGQHYLTRRVHIQTIPGSNVARLWFSRGSDLCYMPIAVSPYSERNAYPYTYQGMLTTSWYNGGLHDIEKLWKSIKLEIDTNSSSDVHTILIDYDLDNGDGWQEIATPVTTSGTVTVPLSSTYDVVSTRIRFRFWIQTSNALYTPRIYAMVLDCLIRAPVRWVVSGYVSLADDAFGLDNAPDSQGAAAKLAILETMASTVEPVYVTAKNPRLHEKYFVIDPMELRPLRSVPDGSKGGTATTEHDLYHVRMIELS